MMTALASISNIPFSVLDTVSIKSCFFLMSTTVVASKKYEDLKILQGTTLTLITPQVTLTKGDYIVKVTVDQTNLLQENNELNNVLQQPLIIG